MRRDIEIWSGGQTGVDRAALDCAMELGLATGGWVPRGRLAEDGTVPARYSGLQEAPTADYAERTALNVRDTDATLVLRWGEAGGGTRQTIEVARQLGRPVGEIDLSREPIAAAANQILAWLAELPVVTRLNVAGPRASQAPDAYAAAREVLRLAFGSGRPHRADSPIG